MPEKPALLAANEPNPVTIHNPDGGSALLIVADHAGNTIPKALGDLGVSENERQRHIAWDIGIAGLCRSLADSLGATLIQQNYSRLVIDCNRQPGSETSMPEISESTAVPGNVAVNDDAKSARVHEIFQPYHTAIEAELDRRKRAGRPAALVAMHSFTPIYKGVSRPWHAGVLYNRDPRFAHLLMALLQREAGLVVGDNEPYSVSDDSDYTIPVHGERRGLHHVAIEVRQDLIAGAEGQAHWAAMLSRLLPQAYRALIEGDGVTRQSADAPSRP